MRGETAMEKYTITEVLWDNWDANPYFDAGFLQLRIDAASPNGAIAYSYEEIRDLAVGRDDEGKIFAFEVELFQKRYPRLIRQLQENPLPYRFDVPEAGLQDATMEQVLRWAYKKFVEGNEGA
jgi:hypothetical protein